MLKRLELFMIATVFLLITAIILIIYSKQREQEFIAHNEITQKAIVNGASYAINLLLLEKNRHVQLFAHEYAALLSQLSSNPTDERTEDDIKIRLQQRFSDFFTYTITDQNGVPKLLNIESLVGHACQADLINYAKGFSNKKNKSQNKVFVHPQPLNYHFDIMAPLYTNSGTPNIFFVSFYLKEITNILKTHEVPGQKLILVRQSDTNLIEVSSQGARDKLKRDIHLSKEEQIQSGIFKNIPGTDWRLITLPDKSYKKQYVKGLWKEAITIMVVVTLALFILILVLLKVKNRRN